MRRKKRGKIITCIYNFFIIHSVIFGKLDVAKRVYFNFSSVSRLEVNYEVVNRLRICGNYSRRRIFEILEGSWWIIGRKFVNGREENGVVKFTEEKISGVFGCV